ncbi:MAG: hypothetical protein PF489_12310 [Salinivirgaceae bacterium]|jgi:hypothetical protein|nr:hypothetical protein [Salinivirgaceae bacterium]
MWRRFNLLVIVTVFTVNGLVGQGKASSPYSVFGLGDLKSSGSIQFSEYGGAATGLLQKNIINFSNPASYRGIDSMRFVIDFGFSNRLTQLENDTESYTSNEFNFTYYAVGFRMAKWLHTSLGLVPTSNRNYRISSSGIVNDVYGENHYVGGGSLNEIYWGNSISILSNLSIGVNLKYYFGELLETKTVLFPDELFTRNTQEGYTRQVNGFGFSTGVMYTVPLREDRTLNIGATFSPEQRIDFKEDYLYGATVGNNLDNIDDNQIIDTTSFYVEKKGYFTLPNKLALGLSYEEPNKRFATVAFDYAMWGEVDNDNIANSLTNFRNSYRLSGGYGFTPKWNSAASYFKRATYRFGAFFENQYIEVNNQPLNEYAVSIGMGLPIRKVNAMLNIGLELGQRGALKEDLIKENYIKLNLKLNFREIWFFERKFD